MTTNETLAALLDEVAGLRAQVEAQEAELAKLRHTDPPVPDPRFGRRHLIGALAGLGAVGAAGLAGAPPAAAADGDPLLLGTETNASTNETRLVHTAPEGTLDVAVNINTNNWIGLGVACTENPDFSFPGFGRVGLWSDVSELTTSGDMAVRGLATDGFGVYSENSSATRPAVAATNEAGGPGLGGASKGGGPQLWLDVNPLDPDGPPTTGLRGLGQIKADGNGDLWLCVADGTPGTWTRLLREDTTQGRTVAINPIRVLDTRVTGGRPSGAPAVPGQKKGPLHGGEILTLDLAGAAGIPATSTGVVGNLTVTGPTDNGFVRAYPAGSPSATSAVNFTTGATSANAFTSRINPTGLQLVAPVSSAITYHLIVDITGYLT